MWLLILLTAVVILAFGVQGYRIGLLRRLIEFAGAIASFLLATTQGPAVAGWLERWPGLHGRAALYVGWIVLFVLGLVVTWLIARGAGRAVQVTIVGWLDRLGGAACGLLIGALFASVMLVAASRVRGGDAVRDAFCAHAPTRLIYRAAPNLYEALRKAGADPHRVWEEIAGSRDRRLV